MSGVNPVRGGSSPNNNNNNQGGNSGQGGSGGSSGSGQSGSGQNSGPPFVIPPINTGSTAPVHDPGSIFGPGLEGLTMDDVVAAAQDAALKTAEILLIAGVILIAIDTAPIWAPIMLGVAGRLAARAAAPLVIAGATTVASTLFQEAGAQQYLGDPILLDLNGDGIKTTDLDHGVMFDHDNNGFQEWSAWVDPNDGMLVADLNNNGIIENGTELLGNHTVLPNGSTAYDGYYALAAYDSNSDGVVDSSDQSFSQLKVLKGDGTLLTLQEAGVKSLSLSGSVSQRIDENGNIQTVFGTYTKLDNTIAQYGDFNLKTNTVFSNPLTWVTVPSNIAALPDVVATGNVYNLRQAMAMDTSNTLKGLVETFLSATNESSRNGLIDQIMAAWTDIPLTTTNATGGMLTAFHLAVVEKFEGQNFNTGDLGFVSTISAGFISQEYNQLAENLYGKLMAQGPLKDYFTEITWGQDSTTEQYFLNLDPVETKIATLYQTDQTSAIAIGAQFSRALAGMNWIGFANYSDFYSSLINLDSDFQVAIDSAGKATIIGTSLNELLGSAGTGAWDLGTGQSSRDTRPYYISAGAGNDTLQGSYSDDILIGGTGNDTLTGYDGNDAYYFNLGDGHDTIIEGNAFIDTVINYHPAYDGRINTGYDSIFFGAGIVSADLSYSLSGDYLNISINGTTDQISILSKSRDYLVEQLVFQDGTVVKMTDIFHTFTLDGTAGNDNLSTQGMFWDIGQHVKGYAGNDSIYSGYGDDTLEGGDGNDSITDRGGNNTIDGGDGDDGIGAYGANNLMNGGAGDDYISNYSGTATISGGDGNDNITSAEGNDSIDAGSGIDTVSSGAGNDTISGGAGNDSLAGGNGNDTYLFNTGFGLDTIDEHNTTGQDLISFGAGINASDAIFTGSSNNNLVVHFNNSTDQVTVVGQITNNSIENFHFADGDLSVAQILSQLQNQGTENADYFSGSSYAESMFGYAGDDQLTGYDGNDTLVGGDGNDYIQGVEGNDSLLGGNGNDDLSGGNGNDIIEGGTGNDSMSGEDGNDTFIGGLGNDYMAGNAGSDTYVFNSGDGYDTIVESANTDNNILSLGAGINASDLTFSFDDHDIWIRSLVNASDRIRVTNQVSNNTIGTIQFSDGTTYTAAQILSHLQSVGTDYNDTVYGSNQAESLFGFAGNDTLYAGAGDDTLDGGDGNDYLAAADGNDSLIGGAGNNTLYGESGDDILLGGAGNDSLYGGDGNDTLNGGTGNDYLVGGNGNDVYNLDSGFGTVAIDENGTTGNDIVNFGSGLSISNAIFTAQPSNTLTIQFTGSSDVVNISNQLTNNSIETFHFSDGTNLTNADILTQLQTWNNYGSNFSESMFGSAGSDQIYAYDGNDTIYGGDGNDTIDASDGNDVVYGENGNDSLMGGNGNDQLSGGSGYNTLLGGEGNDTLSGGAGIDTLQGGNGDDTYLVTSNTAASSIDETSTTGNDTVSFGSGLSLANAIFSGTWNSLNVTFSNAPTVKAQIMGSLASNHIENYHFTDGDITAAQILSQLQAIGTSSNDSLEGSSYSESILGLAGNDSLYGYDGNDTIIGGLGNDSLYGGTGSDTYVYNPGDGYDTIVEDANSDNNILSLGSGLNSSNVALTFDDRDLWVRSLLTSQ